MTRRTTFGTTLAAALIALAAAGAPRPAHAREPTPIEVFSKHYRDRDPRIRLKAVTQLEEHRGADAVRALLRALRDESCWGPAVTVRTRSPRC
jgi:hypothetical protein